MAATFTCDTSWGERVFVTLFKSYGMNEELPPASPHPPRDTVPVPDGLRPLRARHGGSCPARILYLISPNARSCNFESYFLPLFVPVHTWRREGLGKAEGGEGTNASEGSSLGGGKKNPAQGFGELCVGFP